MLYIIHGTNFQKLNLAKEKIKKNLLTKKIIFQDLLLSSEINLNNLSSFESNFQNNSLFGEKILIKVRDILSKEEGREYFYKNLENIFNSQNIFLIEEPFALQISIDKIKRDLEKILSKSGKEEKLENLIFDCVEEIKIKDIEPFYLCELIEKRDKKNAWIEWKKIYQEWENKEEQALHGAIWWKWRNIWMAMIDGDKNNYFRFYKLKEREIKYSLQELEKFGKDLSLMSMRSNNGEINLMKEIEKFILSF